MFKRVPQPPVRAGLRSLERHRFWPGFVAALAGIMLAGVGVWRLTGIETAEGGQATEIQLIKAYASGGLQFPEQVSTPPPPPPMMDDPGAMAEALARWDQENARREPPSWKVRVDVSAKAPCPT